MDAKEFNWPQALREQWEWHWTNLIRPRIEGLTDEEDRKSVV